MKLNTLIITVAIALIVATAAALADEKPRIEITATGGAVYVVVVDGEQVSQHATLHKAMERASNEAFTDLAAEVRVIRDAEWRVVAMGWEPGDPHTPQPPPDEPDEPEPDPITEPDEPSRPAEGFTVFEPSDDTRTIYVSSSEGDDANDGLSPETPKRTLRAGYNLLRDGHPDWLLLRAGDEWSESFAGEWAKSGRGGDEMMLVSSYGDGPRPMVKNHRIRSSFNHPASHVAFVDLDIYASYRDPESPDYQQGEADTVGIWWQHGENILIEGCKVRFWPSYNVLFDGSGGRLVDNIRIRRNVIVDAYPQDGSHSQGLQLRRTTSSLIEENVLDRNGWHPDLARKTVFNHNLYCTENQGLTIRGNITNASSLAGMKLSSNREAGFDNFKVEDNLFLDNRLQLSIDHSSRVAEYSHQNYIIARNVLTASRHDGIGITSSRNGLIERNIMAHKPERNSRRAIFWDDNQDRAHENLVIRDNIAHNWPMSSQTRFPRELPGVTLERNHDDAGGDVFVDPSRTIEGYDESIGGDGSLEGFMREARQQRRGNWREAYTAGAVNEWMREGFNRE